MNYKSLILIALIAFVACKDDGKKLPMEGTQLSTSIAPITDDVLESAIIYEANIRQYSPEGTFDAFTKDIPQLKELGVKIIWVMPIFPISEVKRKATGELFADDIEDPLEREKYLGSYYAVSDFRAVNPEFGTLEDFRRLLDVAHENDIYVILDWVPNHTGWDHVWIKEHPKFYTKNSAGEITEPLNDDGSPVGWADVADLNYDNMELRKQMTADMLYWVKEEGIDGFRCDMAGMVPISFWEQAIPALRAEKDIFMLAEGDNPELTKGDLFEMAYGWEVHHLMNDIAKGEKNAADFDAYYNSFEEKWSVDDILMHFVTNHDENSWAGTVAERMGAAAPALTALTYCMPGMPLIYSGQEYDLNHRLKFFEKDSIPKGKGKTWNLLQKLGEIKQQTPAIDGGKDAASFERLSTTNNQEILAFRREKDGKELIYIANLTNSEKEFNVEFEGDYLNLLTDESINHTQYTTHRFAPWEFVIFGN